MSILWMDGPDHYGTNTGLLTQGPYASNGWGLAANVGPGGKGAAFWNPGAVSEGPRWVLPGNRSSVGVGLRLFMGALPSQNNNIFPIVFKDAGNNIIYAVSIESTGAIVLYAGGAVIASTNPIIVGQSWQHLEVFITFNAGAGVIRLNVNGLPVLNLINQNLSATPCAQVSMRAGNGPNGATTTMFVRDWYVWDTEGAVNNAGMMGDRQVITSFPDNDGPEQDWAYSAGGSGWPLISNNPPDDSQFIYADASGDLSSFDTEDIDTDITSIAAVRLAGRAWKSDAGIGTFSLGMVSSGSKSPVVEQALSTEPIFYTQMVELDPHTAARWSPATLNAAQAEVNRVQ